MSITTFTKAELRAAAWHELAADWHWGYPQPDEGAFGYRKVTYDDSNLCAACGVGLRQVAPFQFVREPAWGRRSLLQVNWIFDEIFVTPELWDSAFRPLGVAAREVHNTRGEPLSTVVQLVVDERIDLDLAGYAYRVCKRCGVVKYETVTRGFFPAPSATPTSAMCRSNQSFGSGALAFGGIMASRDVYAAIQAAGAKGARFIPSFQ